MEMDAATRMESPTDLRMIDDIFTLIRQVPVASPTSYERAEPITAISDEEEIYHGGV